MSKSDETQELDDSGPGSLSAGATSSGGTRRGITRIKTDNNSTNSSRRRACIDLGSGTVKLMVSDVDASSGQILATLLEREIAVNHGADVLQSLKSTGERRLSEGIQAKGIEVLRSYRDMSNALGVKEIVGVATEVYRNAVNGRDYISRIKDTLGIQIYIISQREEAELGFISVVALTGEPIDAACIWDSGNGSFQISKRSVNIPSELDPPFVCLPGKSVITVSASFNEYDCYMAPIGTSFAVNAFKEALDLGKDNGTSKEQSINPVTLETANIIIDKLIAVLPKEVPDWLQSKSLVTAAASPSSIFKLCCDVLSQSERVDVKNRMQFNRVDVESALASCLCKTDEELTALYPFHASVTGPSIIVPKLCLLLAVMRHLGIGEVKCVECLGSCPGIFRNRTFWTSD